MPSLVRQVSNSTRILLAILAAAIIGGLGWFAFSRVEPSFQGRPLHLWLADFDLSRDQRPERATLAVQAIGTNALPLLERMIGMQDPLWKKAILSLNHRQSFLRLQITEAGVVRYRAIEGYRVLGARAKPSVPGLIQILEGEPNVEVRADVAWALGAIGPEARAAIPALLRAAETPHPQLHRSALIAVFEIERSSPDRVLPAIRF